MANYNMNNVSLFHSFSKVAAADNTALSAAVNKAGHVVTASDVWANEIPFCGSADSLADLKIKFADNTAFPVGTLGYDLGSSKLYQKGAEDWSEITPAVVGGYVTISYKEKPVLRWYNKAHLTLLTPENNGAPSNGFSAKYLGPAGDGVGAISQFVSSTDKIVNGIVSDGYDIAVYNGSTKLTKGTSTAAADNQWMDSAYAGMILFMCAQTSTNLSMTCFEYVGEKLDTSISDLRQSIKDISDVTLKGVVASVTAEESTAQKAGITVDNTVSTTPVIKFTAGSVTTGEDKLVTGGAVAVVTDALAGRIAQLEGITHFSVVVVPDGQTIENVTPLVENTIYLVKDANAAEGTYIEYIAYKPKNSETVVTEKIGSTAIDLSGYTTDAEHTALAGRVTTVEGKVTTLESQVATLNGSATTAGSVAKALADAKSYAKEQASAAQSAAESNAAAALTSALEQVAEDIEAAKNEAISSAEVTITAGTGIVVTPEGKGTTFEIAVSDDVATAASVTALSEVVASNKTELDGKIDGVSGRVTTLEEQVSDLTTGDSSVDSKISDAVETIKGEISEAVSTLEGKITSAQQTADAAKGKADTAVQTVSKDGSSTLLTVTQTGTAVTVGLSDTVATKTDAANAASSAITTSLAGTTSGTIGYAVADAKKAGTDAMTEAKAKVSSVSGPNTGLVTVSTNSDTKAVTITVDEKLASTDDITLTGITLNGTTVTPTNKVANITAIEGVTTTAVNGIALGKDSNNVKVSVTTASYTAATGDATVGSWSNKDNVVTGTAVDTRVADAIKEAKAYSDSLHTTSLDYVVLGDSESLPSASADTLGKIYLVTSQNAPSTDGSALSGSYVEYMTRKVSETEYTWEKIGTTSADLTAYAKKAELNVTSTTANGLTYSQTNGVVSVSVNAASTTQVGTVQLTDGYTSTDDTNAATGKSIAAAIDTLDAEKSVNGITVTQENGVITSVTEELITATVPTGTTSVDGNVAYVGSAKHVIAPEKFQTAAQMPSTLTSWVADLSNLTNGDNMFKGCIGLTVFVGDLSALTSGVDMFNGCTLDAESLEILSENLPTVSGGTIDIGASTNATEEVIATIKGKGWTTLKSNGVAL